MEIQVLCHSSIKIKTEGKIIYSDPFRVKEVSNDADMIIITHSHYDHFSEEDIGKVKKQSTRILVTEDLLEKTLALGFKKENIVVVIPNENYEIEGIEIATIPAYNTNKKFHPKEKGWVGYLLNIEGQKIYIAGDTDITEENKKIECDVALVPVGGTYTMTYEEAAELVNIIKPKTAIPMHYGEIVGETQDGLKFKELVNCEIQVNILIQ